jgi:cytoskeleton protein RodZ
MSESLGEHFQKAREAKGLTLEEAAARTRILPQYLKAVEDNNYAKLPDEVFAKGFVRSYARILGLDEATVIRQFDESGGQFYAKRNERESLKQKQEEEERRKKVNRNIVAGMVSVALLILFVLMGRDRDRPEPRPVPTDPVPAVSIPAPAPVPEPLRAEPPPPAGDPVFPSVSGQPEVERNFSGVLPLEGVAPDEKKKMILDVEALERCWVKVQADHTPAQEVLLNPGDRTRWKAQERLTLTLGNAGGVRVSLNGKPQGPFGGRGQVVREIVFTP